MIIFMNSEPPVVCSTQNLMIAQRTQVEAQKACCVTALRREADIVPREKAASSDRETGGRETVRV